MNSGLSRSGLQNLVCMKIVCGTTNQWLGPTPETMIQFISGGGSGIFTFNKSPGGSMHIRAWMSKWQVRMWPWVWQKKQLIGYRWDRCGTLTAKPKFLQMTQFQFWDSHNWSIKKQWMFLKLYSANSQNCFLKVTKTERYLNTHGLWLDLTSWEYIERLRMSSLLLNSPNYLKAQWDCWDNGRENRQMRLEFFQDKDRIKEWVNEWRRNMIDFWWKFLRQ